MTDLDQSPSQTDQAFELCSVRFEPEGLKSFLGQLHGTGDVNLFAGAPMSAALFGSFHEGILQVRAFRPFPATAGSGDFETAITNVVAAQAAGRDHQTDKEPHPPEKPSDESVVRVSSRAAQAAGRDHQTDKEPHPPEKPSGESVVRVSSRGEAIQDLQLVGWCSIRPVALKGLSRDDIDIHQSYFPRHSDILLLLRRTEEAGYRAELYSRSPTGAFSAEQHRVSSFFLPFDSSLVTAPILVPILPVVDDNFYLRCYEITQISEWHERLKRWKSRARGTLNQRWLKVGVRKWKTTFGLLRRTAANAVVRARSRGALAGASAPEPGIGADFAVHPIHHGDSPGSEQSASTEPAFSVIESPIFLIGQSQASPRSRFRLLYNARVWVGAVVLAGLTGVLLHYLTLNRSSSKSAGSRSTTALRFEPVVSPHTRVLNGNLSGTPKATSSIATDSAANRRFAAESVARLPDAILSRHFNGHSYEAPQPLAKPIPDLTSISGSIAAVREVAVNVGIDASGHVTDARLAHASSNANLNGAALLAAREWTFSPARSHGKIVASSYKIVFRFTPSP